MRRKHMKQGEAAAWDQPGGNGSAGSASGDGMTAHGCAPERMRVLYFSDVAKKARLRSSA